MKSLFVCSQSTLFKNRLINDEYSGQKNKLFIVECWGGAAGVWQGEQTVAGWVLYLVSLGSVQISHLTDVTSPF